MTEVSAPTGLDQHLSATKTTPENFVDRRKNTLEARAEQARWLMERHDHVISQHNLDIPDDLKDSGDFLDNVFYFYNVHAEVTRRFTPDLKQSDIPQIIEHAVESAIPQTVSERRRIVAEDYHPKAYDPEKGLTFLTESAFRREANDFLQKVKKDPEHHRAAVAMSDINNFKMYNSVYNESVGDNAIKDVALGITRALRPEDPKGKIGGDEDVALIEERLVETEHAATPTYQEHPAERMRKIAGETRDYDIPEGVSITVGYSRLNPGEELQAGLNRASDAKKVGNLIPAEDAEPENEAKSVKNRAIEARIDLGTDIYEDLTSGGTLYMVGRNESAVINHITRKQKNSESPDKQWDVIQPEGQKLVLANPRPYRLQDNS